MWPRQDRILQRQFFAEQECAMLVRHMLEASAASCFSALKRLNIGMQTSDILCLNILAPCCSFRFRGTTGFKRVTLGIDTNCNIQVFHTIAIFCSDCSSTSTSRSLSWTSLAWLLSATGQKTIEIIRPWSNVASLTQCMSNHVQSMNPTHKRQRFPNRWE